MKKFFIPGSLALITLINPSCHRSSENLQSIQGPSKPNVLIIITDDQGWGDIASHGNDKLSTPNLDKLASQSFRFDRFYVSPVCAPTRASLLTGRYHLRTGVHGVTGRREVMRNSEFTLAELFRSEDYRTSYFGKWHNGADFPHNPNGQGFDHFFGFSAGHWNNYFDTKLEWNGTMLNTRGYITDVLTDSVIAEIIKNKRTPFLQIVSYNVPHSPFQVPDNYFKKYKDIGLDDKTACVYGMVENADTNIGRILTAIEENGIAENTLILFLSDNGPNTWRFNGGLKGIKGSVDEGGIKVPCFLKIPWISREEIHITEMAAHIDVLPTLAALAGIYLPDGLLVDGINLLPILISPKGMMPERVLYTDRGLGSKIPFSLRTANFLLTVNDNDTLLFDIKSDPKQETNLSLNFRNEIKLWLKDYDRWYAEVTAFGLKPPSIQSGYLKFPSVELSAHEASFSNNVRFKEGHGWANDWLVNFRLPDDSIQWNVNINKSGDYRLILKLNSPHQNISGELIVLNNQFKSSFRMDQAFPAKEIVSPDRVKRMEVYEKSWSEWDMGQIYLEQGEYPIILIPGNKGFTKEIEIKSLNLELNPI